MPARELPFWSLPVDDVPTALDTSASNGLSAAEAYRRLATYGPNLTVPRREVRWWAIFWEEVREPMILLLVALAAAYFVFGETGEAVAVAVITAGIVTVEVWTEFRAKRAIAALDRLGEPAATVIRDGAVASVPAPWLVPGDIVYLQAGDRVPADLRLLSTGHLAVDESVLTGESFPQQKDAAPVAAEAPLADRRCMLWAGTLVTAGEGLGVVTATGLHTEVARVAGLGLRARPPRTPLQTMMRELAGVLARIAVAAAVVIPVLLWVWGRLSPGQALLTGLSLAFATIPEELPILVTLGLGLGAWQLARRKAVVKRLAAAETLGHVTGIITDKTGTLTANHLRLVRLVPFPGAEEADGELAAAALASVGYDGAGVTAPLVDPVDRAIVEVLGEQHSAVQARWGTMVDRIPFERARGFSGAVFAGQDGRVWVVKGEPERLAAGLMADVASVVDGLAREGYRVLGVATAREAAAMDGRLRFLGLLAFADPVRPEVRPAVESLGRAGVKVWMATGDHAVLAGIVARAAGIAADNMLLGTDIDRMSDDDLAARLGNGGVCARITPAQKLRIVQVLQKRGEILAMLGDGINDVPALCAASVGVAMGEGGTDAAREQAGIVLSDNSFATVAEAVAVGRSLFVSLQKGVRYYLAVKLGLVLAMLVPALLGLVPPLSAAMIILLEMFMDLAASTAMLAENAEGDLMGEPPRSTRQKFFEREFLAAVAVGGTGLALAVWLGVLGAVHGLGGWRVASAGVVQSAGFVSWMTGHVLLAFAARRKRKPAWSHPLFNNLVLNLWAAGAMAAALVVVYVSPVRTLLQTSRLSPGAWWWVAIVPAAIMVILGSIPGLFWQRA